MSAVAIQQPAAEQDVASHVIPAGVPHFKSFEHITDPRVRRAKEYEQTLEIALALGNCPPEYAGRLKKEIEWARAEQTRDQNVDREAIYRAVQFPLTRSEIAEDTGLPASTVWKRLQELLDSGRVRETKRPVQGNNKFVLIYSKNPILP
ncbi:MAG TPA: winged helix-turn-helix domain-containing protein [Pyrinomonadaceae bacterium]|jgi:DNA-directed RNA polymerase specialized sigma24 family protein|nr:winged helix-turn-helix domain-containing protein [Pyrinomonadaceae bacterium]